MALRLTGERYSVVQGLDEQGWVKMMKTNNLLVKELSALDLAVRDRDDNAYRGIACSRFMVADGIYPESGSTELKIHSASNATYGVTFKSHDGAIYRDAARLVNGYFFLSWAKLSGDLYIDGYYISGWSTQTTVGGAGVAAALPANPTGYAKIKIGGTIFAVPYYNAA